MAIKKKGTPEKINVVETLEQLKELIEKSINSEVEVKLVKKSKQNKSK